MKKYVCQICGQEVEVEEGEVCPICGAPHEMLVKIDNPDEEK